MSTTKTDSTKHRDQGLTLFTVQSGWVELQLEILEQKSVNIHRFARTVVCRITLLALLPNTLETEIPLGSPECLRNPATISTLQLKINICHSPRQRSRQGPSREEATVNPANPSSYVPVRALSSQCRTSQKLNKISEPCFHAKPYLVHVRLLGPAIQADLNSEKHCETIHLASYYCL